MSHYQHRKPAPFFSRIARALGFARRPAQPAWLRDARDEDLLKVGLTRASLQTALLSHRAAA